MFASIRSKEHSRYCFFSAENEISDSKDNYFFFEYITSVSLGSNSPLPNIARFPNLNEIEDWLKSSEINDPTLFCAWILNICLMLVDDLDENELLSLLHSIKEEIPTSPLAPFLSILVQQKYSVKTLMSLLVASIFLSNTGPCYRVQIGPNAYVQTVLDPRKAFNHLFSIGRSWLLEEEMILMPILFSFKAPYCMQDSQTLPGISSALLQATSPLLNLLGLHITQNVNFHFLCLLPKLLPLFSVHDKGRFLKSAALYLGTPLDEVFYDLPVPIFKKRWHMTVAKCGHTRAAIELCKTQEYSSPSFFLMILSAIHTHSYLDTSRLLAYLRKKGHLGQIAPNPLFKTLTKLLDHIHKSQVAKEMRLGCDPLLIHVSEEMAMLVPSIENHEETTKRVLWQVRELRRCHEFKLARTLIEHLLEHELTIKNIAIWITILEAHLAETESLSEIYAKVKQFFSKMEVRNLLKQSLKLQERVLAFRQSLLERVIEIENDVEKFFHWINARSSPSLYLENSFSHLIVQNRDLQTAKKLINVAAKSRLIPPSIIVKALVELIESSQSVDSELFIYLFALLKDPSLWNKNVVDCVIKYIQTISLNISSEIIEMLTTIIPTLFTQLMEQQEPHAEKYVIRLHALSIPIRMPLSFWIELVSTMPFHPQQSPKIFSIAKKSGLNRQEAQCLELIFSKQWFLFSKDEEQGACFVENLLSCLTFSENEKQLVIQLFWLSLEYLRGMDMYERALELIEKAFLFDNTLLSELVTPLSELLETKINQSQLLSFIQSSQVLMQGKIQIDPIIVQRVRAVIDRTISPPFSSFAKKKTKVLSEIFTQLPLMFTQLQWKNCLDLLSDARSISIFNMLMIAEKHSIFKNQNKIFFRFIEKTIAIVIKLDDAKVKQAYLFQLLELNPLPIRKKVFPVYLDAYYLLIRESLNSLIARGTTKEKEICILLCAHLRRLQNKCNKYFPFNENYLPPHKLLRRLPECLTLGSVVYHVQDDEYSTHTNLIEALGNEDVFLLPCVDVQNKIDRLALDLIAKIIKYARQKNVWARPYIEKMAFAFMKCWHSVVIWQSTSSLFNSLIVLDLSKCVYELAQIFRQLQPIEIDYHSIFHYLIEKESQYIEEISILFKSVYENSDLVDKRTASLFLTLFNALLEGRFSISHAWDLLSFLETSIMEAVSTPLAWKNEAKTIHYICTIRLFLKIGCRQNRARVLSLIDDIVKDLTLLEKTNYIETLFKALSDQIIELFNVEFCSYGLLIDRSFELWSHLNLLNNSKFITEAKLYFIESYLKRFFFEKEGKLDYDLLIWLCYLIRILFLDHSHLKREVQRLSQSIQKIADKVKGPIDLIPLCRKLIAPKGQNSYFDDLFNASRVFYPYHAPNSPTGLMTISDLLKSRFLENCKNYLFNAPSLFVHFGLRVYRGEAEQCLEVLLSNISLQDYFTKLIFESLQPAQIKNNEKIKVILFSLFNQKIILYHQSLKECDEQKNISELEISLCHHFYFIIKHGLYTVSIVDFFELAYRVIPHFARLYKSNTLPPCFEKKSFNTLLTSIEKDLLGQEPSCCLYLLACKVAWEKSIRPKSPTLKNLIKNLNSTQLIDYLNIVKALSNL